MSDAPFTDQIQDLPSTVVEIDALRFWRDVYSVIYPGSDFQRFLASWRKAKQALRT